jgi:exonuclease III
MDMKFGTWNVRSLYRAGSRKTVTSELAKYNLDLVAVQEVRWDKGDSQTADDRIFFYGNWNANHPFGTGFLVVQNGILLAVKGVECISDRCSV